MWFLFSLLNYVVIGLVMYGFYIALIRRKSITGSEIKPTLPTIKIPPNLLWSVLLLVTAFNVFVYSTHVGIGIGVFFALTSLALLYTFQADKRTQILQGLVLFVAVIGLLIGFRANGFVQGVNIAIVVVVLIFIVGIHASATLRWSGLWLMNLFLRVFVLSFANIPSILKNATSSELQSDGTVTHTRIPIIQIVKITVLTITLVLVFGAMLSAADPVFAELMENLMDQAFGRIVVSIIIAIIAVVALTIEASEYLKEYNPQFKWFSFLEVIIPVLSVVLLFGAFLFIQAKYLFGAHADLESFGLTYSQYARRGFVELLIVTFTGSVLVYGVYLKQSVADIQRHVSAFKVVNAVIIAELFLMLLSALKRDFLYVDMFGITRTRIIGGIFVVWLAGFLVSLLLLVWVKKMREQHLFIAVSCLTVFVAAALNMINVDRIIALAAPPEGSYKDYFYINSLSEDAFVGWKESVPMISDFYEGIYQNPSPDNKQLEQFTNYKLAIIALQEKRDSLVNKYAPEKYITETQYIYRGASFSTSERAFGSFNFSEFSAYRNMLNDQGLFFTTLDCLSKQMQQYQYYYDLDTYDFERERLYDYEYPFVNAQRDYSPSSIIHEDAYGTATASGLPPTSCAK